MSPRTRNGADGDVYSALASSTRRRLLEVLRAGDGPRDAHDLARGAQLHVTTVRSHLEVLRRAGLVTRGSRPQPGAGRPRTTYLATGHPETAESAAAYEELAALLAANLEDNPEGRSARAERAGFSWAEQLPPTTSRTDLTLDEAADHLVALFADIGFGPEPAASTGRRRQILLHACPFRAVARIHPEVVCSIHLGLLRGTLARIGTPVDARILPFVEPELCVAQLGNEELTS